MNNNLDNYYMSLAELAAQNSDYSNTKVGAVIVKDNSILSIGYNHLLNGFTNNNVPVDNEDSDIMFQRNSYNYHAEQDAVFKYHGSVQDFKGATAYINISPCHECSKMLIGLGIKEIVYKEEYHRKHVCNLSMLLLQKCGVIYRRLGE